MALASVTYAGVNGQQTYTIPFGFLQQGHLEVRIDGVLQVLTTDYTISTPGTQITFVDAIVGGEVLYIRRNTPQEADDQLVNFTSGAILSEEALDTCQLQIVYAAEEMRDDLEAVELTPDVLPPVTGGDENSMLVVKSSAWDVRTAAEVRSDLGLGSAAQLNSGTATNNVVQYGGTNLLPAAYGPKVKMQAGVVWVGAVADLDQDSSGTWYQTGSGHIMDLVTQGVAGATGTGLLNNGGGANITPNLAANSIQLTAGSWLVELNLHIVNGSAVVPIQVQAAITDNVDGGSQVLLASTPVVDIVASGDHRLTFCAAFSIASTTSIQLRLVQTDADAVTIILRGDSYIKITRMGDPE